MRPSWAVCIMGMRLVRLGDECRYGLGMRLLSSGNQFRYGLGMRLLSSGNQFRYGNEAGMV